MNLAIAEMKADGTLDATPDDVARQNVDVPGDPSNAPAALRPWRRGPELYEYQPGDPRLPDGDRGSKMLGPLRAEGAQSVAIAVVSTVVVLRSCVVAGRRELAGLAARSSSAFFNREEFKESFPRSIVQASCVNVQSSSSRRS